MCERFPGKIVLGIDAKYGRVATQGWLEVSELPALELARRCGSLPLAALVYTDISRDGMMMRRQCRGDEGIGRGGAVADHRLGRRHHHRRRFPTGSLEFGRLHRGPGSV